MAKKNFTNLDKNNHMGGGINNLIPETSSEKKEEKSDQENSDAEAPKTFYMLESDHKYLLDYARFMAFHKNAKYPIKTAVHDAIQLLREKYPNVINK